MVLSAGWWVVAGRFGAAVDDWIAARRAEGYRIDAPAPLITGFPLRWVAHFPTVSTAAPSVADAPPSWAWQGHAVTVSWSLLDRNAVHLGTSGTSSLDLTTDGRSEPMLIDSDGAELRLETLPQRIEHITFHADRLSLSMAGADATAQSLGFDLTIDQAAPADHRIEAGKLSLEAKELALMLPGQTAPSFTVSGAIAASLRGKPPPGKLADSIAAWRDEGGTVELTEFDARSGNVAVSGSGTIALDGAMRPLGAGTANLRGFDQAVDRLVAAGQMSGRDAPLAKLAFNALAKPDPTTGAMILTLPVSAENGFLFLGPIKVAPLRPLKLD